MVVEHTKSSHQQAALKVRDLAQLVIMHKDEEGRTIVGYLPCPVAGCFAVIKSRNLCNNHSKISVIKEVK